MRNTIKLISIPLLTLFYPAPEADAEALRLAVTTTTENSGLMSKLNAAFENEHDIKVKVITVGSRQALKLAEQGDVDVVLTHAPEDEKKFIETGYGIKRHPVMFNDFILLGPANDSWQNQEEITSVFRGLFTDKRLFISRGDQSGTHKKELQIWEKANLAARGEWYIASGTGMGATLLIANQRRAYTLSDRGTYLAFKDKLNLEIIHQGDPLLHNPYHVIAVNPERFAHINAGLARKYIEYLTGDKAGKIINDYKIGGQQLFYIKPETTQPVLTENQERHDNDFFTAALIASFELIINVDRSLFYVVWTSLKVSLLAVFFAGLFSVPLGVIVALNNFTGKNLLLSCLNTLMALPTVVVGLLLYGLLNRQGLLGDLGLLYTPVAMVIGQCVLIIPVIWNLCIAAINSADPRLEKMCSSLGANYLQRGLIYMSEVRFALMAAIVAGFGRAIGEVGIAMMLGGNIHGYTRTMTTAIALETSKGDFEFALALGFMLLLVAFAVNIGLQHFQLRVK